MSKHTPGEWIGNGDQVEVRSEHNDGYRICDVFGPDYKANARLIAAAPDLLEALRLLIGADGEGTMFSERVNKARHAIAKAEGRS